MALPKYWTTREGVKLQIAHMEDRHLLFSLRLVQEAERDWVPPSGFVQLAGGAMHFTNGVMDFCDDGNGNEWWSFEDHFMDVWEDDQHNHSPVVRIEFPGLNIRRALEREVKKRGLKSFPLRPSKEELERQKKAEEEKKNGDWHGPVCVCDRCM